LVKRGPVVDRIAEYQERLKLHPAWSTASVLPPK
jgi:hypothetical protein